MNQSSVTNCGLSFLDTLLSMGIGWAINSAMILVAAAAFFQSGLAVTELEQAAAMLEPMLGRAAFLIFALALLFAGLSSSVTAGMAGGSIYRRRIWRGLRCGEETYPAPESC